MSPDFIHAANALLHLLTLWRDNDIPPGEGPLSAAMERLERAIASEATNA